MGFMEKETVLYRGSLKSCNYRCSYCPFSKHRGSEREYERDRRQWFRFVDSLLEDRGEAERGREREGGCGQESRREREREGQPRSVGALMVVPYGEALIHGWYWQGLGRLAAKDEMDCVGAQTNLSFPVEQSLEEYRNAGGQMGKLRLWATFHPEMTDVKTFAERCRELQDTGTLICAGAVGVPGNMEVIWRLRQLLPDGIYLWVNKMDGLGRCYTEEEIRGFRQADPLFDRELVPVEADSRKCAGRLFVEADGRVRACNISGDLGINWYDRDRREAVPGPPVCVRKRCSCYLAYGGRKDVMNRVLFGPYPVFRIPQNPGAVFLDIDGTLIGEGERKVSRFAKADLELIASQGKTRLFFATSLPYEEAVRKCGEIWGLFSGGVFSAGAHVVLHGESKDRERVCLMAGRMWIERLREESPRGHFRVLVYERWGIACKVTLVRSGKKPWQEQEINQVRRWLREGPEAVGRPVRVFEEGACLQIVAEEACKEEGVKTLCGWLGISPRQAAAAGDSREDRNMVLLCGGGA